MQTDQCPRIDEVAPGPLTAPGSRMLQSAWYGGAEPRFPGVSTTASLLGGVFGVRMGVRTPSSRATCCDGSGRPPLSAKASTGPSGDRHPPRIFGRAPGGDPRLAAKPVGRAGAGPCGFFHPSDMDPPAKRKWLASDDGALLVAGDGALLLPLPGEGARLPRGSRWRASRADSPPCASRALLSPALSLEEPRAESEAPACDLRCSRKVSARGRAWADTQDGAECGAVSSLAGRSPDDAGVSAAASGAGGFRLPARSPGTPRADVGAKGTSLV